MCQSLSSLGCSIVNVDADVTGGMSHVITGGSCSWVYIFLSAVPYIPYINGKEWTVSLVSKPKVNITIAYTKLVLRCLQHGLSSEN